jgi:hypothetical protein
MLAGWSMVPVQPVSRPEGPQTPRDLAKHALDLADSANTQNQALKAVTTAIVALAGEIHQLSLREVKVDKLSVEGVDLVTWAEDLENLFGEPGDDS